MCIISRFWWVVVAPTLTNYNLLSSIQQLKWKILPQYLWHYMFLPSLGTVCTEFQTMEFRTLYLSHRVLAFYPTVQMTFKIWPFLYMAEALFRNRRRTGRSSVGGRQTEGWILWGASEDIWQAYYSKPLSCGASCIANTSVYLFPLCEVGTGSLRGQYVCMGHTKKKRPCGPGLYEAYVIELHNKEVWEEQRLKEAEMSGDWSPHALHCWV